MGQMVSANITLDIFSIVLSLVPVAYLLSSQRYQQAMNRHFLGICISNICMILGDIPDWLMKEVSSPWEKVILSVSSVLFYTASAFVLYFFAQYINEYLKLSGRAKRNFLAMIRILWGVQIFFAVISPFTGAIFHVTESGYQRGIITHFFREIPLPSTSITMIICQPTAGRSQETPLSDLKRDRGFVALLLRCL